jgi:hypothetical protein
MRDIDDLGCASFDRIQETCQMTSLQATNRLDLRVDRSVYKR